MVIFNAITVSLPHVRTCYKTSFIYFVSSDSGTQNWPCTRAIDAEKLDFKTVHHLPNPQYNMPYSSVIFPTPQPKYKFYFDNPMNTALRLRQPKIVFRMTRQNLQHSSCKQCIRTGKNTPRWGGLIKVEDDFNTHISPSLPPTKCNRFTCFGLEISC